MTASPITAWLATIGLERYASLFEENEVDEETLRVLTDADLAELGLPFGPRKKLLAALDEADRETVTATRSRSSPVSSS